MEKSLIRYDHNLETTNDTCSSGRNCTQRSHRGNDRQGEPSRLTRTRHPNQQSHLVANPQPHLNAPPSQHSVSCLPSHPAPFVKMGAVHSQHPLTMRAIAASHLTFRIGDWARQRFSLRACLRHWATAPARWTPVARPARVVGLD
jgi:hypothetical protein